MRLMRALALVLVATAGAGSTFLDICVLGCESRSHAHQAPRPEQHAADCHQGIASADQSQWQGTSICHHDHGDRSADVGTQSRPEIGLKAMGLAVTLRTTIPSQGQRLVSRTLGGTEIEPPLQSATFLSPLRL